MRTTEIKWNVSGFNISIGDDLSYLLSDRGSFESGELRNTAHLIAAAPEMLECLEDILNVLLYRNKNANLSVNDLERMRDLVIRAKGL